MSVVPPVALGSELESALALAASGRRIFPVIKNTADPLIPAWRDLATTDQSVIRACWAANEKAGFGFVVDSLLVLRTDTVAGVFALGDFFERHIGKLPTQVIIHN